MDLSVTSHKAVAYGQRYRKLVSWPFLLVGTVVLVLISVVKLNVNVNKLSPIPKHYSANDFEHHGIAISYAYVERDSIQRGNMAYFLKAGTQKPASGQYMEWVFVSATPICEPCSAFFEKSVNLGSLVSIGVFRHYVKDAKTLLIRTENVGMDLASHNITLQYLAHKQRMKLFRYFIFINSSTFGPFYPSYLPENWHWTYAFLSRMGGPNAVHAVSSSLVCLPEADAGGPGPRMESWALAMDKEGLDIVVKADVFKIRSCKLCVKEGIVTGGEYGISKALLDANANFTTLMSRYAPDTDWSNKRHWSCNDNVHPSRHGTYAGISFHPFETIFVKSSWHVSDPYTARYSKWASQHLSGEDGTRGFFDRALYQYSKTPQSREPNPLFGTYMAVTATAQRIAAQGF